MAEQIASHPPDHNGMQVLRGVTQREFLNWIDELRGLDEEVAAAVDRRKAYLSDVKQRLGKDEFASFKGVRKDAEMAGESRERRELSRRQMMQWLNKPLGFQPAFDLETDDPGLAALNEHELAMVDHEAMAAGKNGHHRETNPWTPGTELAARWDSGWLRGQAEIASTLAPNGDAQDDSQPKRRGRPRGSGNRPSQVH